MLSRKHHRLHALPASHTFPVSQVVPRGPYDHRSVLSVEWHHWHVSVGSICPSVFGHRSITHPGKVSHGPPAVHAFRVPIEYCSVQLMVIGVRSCNQPASMYHALLPCKLFSGFVPGRAADARNGADHYKRGRDRNRSGPYSRLGKLPSPSSRSGSRGRRRQALWSLTARNPHCENCVSPIRK